jgi:hypothetical protein
MSPPPSAKIICEPHDPSAKIIQRARTEFFSKIFSRAKKYFPKNFSENFPKIFLATKKFYKKNSGNFPGRDLKKSGTHLFDLHAVNLPQKPLPGTPFFAIHTIPNPGLIRPPIPHFTKTEPHTRPDLDPPTPCLVQKSWKILLNRVSG